MKNADTVSEDYEGYNDSVVGMSVPDELGAKINEVISPDIFEFRDDENQDLYTADFMCNITAGSILMGKFPQIAEGQLQPNRKYIYFMCKHFKLRPDRMADYINDMAGEFLTKKIEPDDMKYLGAFDMKRSGGERMDLFVVPKDEYSDGDGSFERKQDIDPVKKAVVDAYEKIRDGYSEEALMVRYGDKEYLKRFFVTDDEDEAEAYGKLEDGNTYLLLFAIAGTIRIGKCVKVANAINASAEIFGDREIEPDDVEEIGTVNRRHRTTNQYYDLDVFAVKA